MRVLVQNTLTNRQWIGFDGPSGFLIGRDATCHVKLDSRFISNVHARVERSEAGWDIELLAGVNPVEIDGKECKAGQKTNLKNPAVLRIMEFVLTLEEPKAEASQTAAASDAELTELQNLLHAHTLRRLDLRLGGWTNAERPGDRTDQLNRIVDDLLLGEFKAQVFESPLTPLIIQRALRARTSDWLFKRLSPGIYDQKQAAEWHQVGVNPDMEASIENAVLKIARQCGIQDLTVGGGGVTKNKNTLAQEGNLEELLDERFDSVVITVVEALLENVRTYLVISYLKKTLYDMIFGLGPLEDLLRSPSITEIMVVSPSQIYIERNGRIVKIPQTFPSEDAAISIIERIVSPLGRRIDRSQPLVDARLRDGSRVNAIIEPLAIKGPCITIRKFPSFKVTVDDLVRWHSITNSAVALLRACILNRCNVLISGGTGSGKTTLLNVLSGMIPAHERLVTIEDSAELRLQQDHVVSLETKPANSEGTGQYTIRDLVKNALRMRPDRIIVGECRGDETVDMLQAMNTGHRGSMTTLHANSTQDAVARLETMILMGSDIPLAAVRRQIASAIHLIVHTERLGSGQRLVWQISEVLGLHPLSGEVETRDIMHAQEIPANSGNFVLRPTGYMPRFLGELVDKNFLQLHSWFDQVKVS